MEELRTERTSLLMFVFKFKAAKIVFLSTHINCFHRRIPQRKGKKVDGVIFLLIKIPSPPQKKVNSLERGRNF